MDEIRSSSDRAACEIETLRRAGQLTEARDLAMTALREDDSPALHLAMALVLIDLADTDAVAKELVEAFTALTGFKEPLEAVPQTGDPLPAPDALDQLHDVELENAFLEAESRPDEMWNANHAAEAALAQVEEGAPEGVSASPESPFATATMASLLEDQGHADEARALRDAIDGESDDSAARLRTDRDRIVETLELWLENLRRAS